ncbi:hypothetical protein [Staphylococcus aureus]|nr:hypothetical protein [Staphylococcus aureus]EGQ0540420.1 hypothetical protein [Staphylococcus aureus]EZY65407.1 hypothetical protein V061_00015 [Staphylococcus aureus R0353]EZY66200.1 hypothetical protein V060_00015 [Staphylococcus aureus R0294]EZY68658.1 hypothetical protein V064_02614 [Staphylococcus aureus R0545]EZY68725.1 hypothetical protein V062_00030 [Staphylococcus aureus R0357]
MSKRFIIDMGYWYEAETLAYPLLFSDMSFTYFIMWIERGLEWYKNPW